MTLRATLFLSFGLSISCADVFADDWPQFRGPRRDAVSQERNLLMSWPVEGPKLLWQIKDAGFGFGSVAVANGRIYLVSSRGKEEEYLAARDAKDGRPLWTARLGLVGNPDQVPAYSGARSTPTVDGGLIYALGSDGDLVCVEAANGSERWRKSLRRDFGGKPGIWAYAESPLVDGPRVIVTPGAPGAAVVALDKKTGETIWKCSVPGDDPPAYSSALVADVAGTRQVVAYIGRGLVGIDSATGKFLWRFDKVLDRPFNAHAASPIISGSHVYAAASPGGGLASVKKTANDFTAETVYVERKAPRTLGGSVKVGEYLYGASGTVLLCTEFATGKLKWEDRGVGAASILYADGRLYLHGENGELALVEATPDAYRELGRFTPPDPPTRGYSKAWNYPAVSNGRLYIRDLGVVWVYDLRAPKASR